MYFKKDKKRIYIKNREENAFLNLSIKADSVYIELLKVLPEYRGSSLAKKLLSKTIEYISTLGYKIIRLNPLPLDSNGLDFEQLVGFYKKMGFVMVSSKDISQPYLMEKRV